MSRERIAALRAGFGDQGYICSEQVATACYLATELEKPLFVEGPPGVGKTELGKVAAAHLGLPLIRLQCYEGLDEAKALYEWKYGKQLLYTQVLREQLDSILGGVKALDQAMARLEDFDDAFFSEQFLEPRPLLQALRSKEGCVLLVDEVDKADEEFESLLLEILSDFQVSVPELGTQRAQVKPLVFLTSNDTREVSDALKRRCLHLYIPYPELALERAILNARVPELGERLRHKLVVFVQALRELDLKKAPAISETLDWARALVLLHAEELSGELVRETLNLLLKYQRDIEVAERELHRLLAKTASIA